jgi:hypothetical protein
MLFSFQLGRREGGKERAKFHDKKIRQQLIANIQKTLYSVLYSFCGFYYTNSKRKTYEVPTRYSADTGEDS